MDTYKKTIFLLLFIVALILFKNPQLANENEVNCFPFKENWGISTEEFKKIYKYISKTATDEENYYFNEINLYGENTFIVYAFQNEALFQVKYFSSEKPETERLLFQNYVESLKCLFGEPKDIVSVKEDGINAYFIIWEKDKTTAYLSFIEKSPPIYIIFYDNSNPNNKKRIEEREIFIKKSKLFIRNLKK